MNKQNKKKSKNKKQNKSVILGIIVTILVMITLLGLTYAYYRTKVIGNSEDKTINTPTKVLKIEYQDDNPEVVTDNQFEPGKSVKKEFKVRNVGDDTGNYSIILDNIKNENERTWDIRYSLKNKTSNTELVKGTLGKELKRQIVYADIEIGVGITDEYILELEYENPDEDQSIDMGKEISFKIDIIEAHENIFEGLVDPNTLLYAIGRDNEVVNPLTTPGRGGSTEEEAELSYTEDDYGTSYYYRGNVKNNYVTFGEMCWRIVRVQGDGSIKIVLADGERTCNDDSYTTGSSESSFIVTSAYKEYSTDKRYVKYSDSKIPDVLDKWLNDKNIAENQYIDTEAEWCNDISEFQTSTSVPDYRAFGTAVRILIPNDAIPSLRCDFVGINDSKSEKYPGAVGLLSGDEVTFAGGYNDYYNLYNNSFGYYLNDNSNGTWWTLSPEHYSGANAYVFAVDSRGLLSTVVVNKEAMVRPSLVISKSVTLDGGNGTLSSPYIISK